MFGVIYFSKSHARMAELADAHGSGPCGINPVEVRIFLRAPQKDRMFLSCLFRFFELPDSGAIQNIKDELSDILL